MDRICEKPSYEHVGVTSCLFEEDMSGVEDRLSKARRALNAISGLGKRRNGLSVATCCLIFWVIVAPIALYGSELLVLNNKSMKLFEDFQTYAGRRIQRLFSRSPKICSFYGLGWIRLERFIEVKKLLFVRSVLSLGLDEPSRRVFCSRLEDYLVNVDVGVANVYGSNVFDMLNVASDIGVLDDVVSMARLGHRWSKDMWKKKIWKRAWDMDEYFWAIQTLCHRSLDLLANVCGGGGILSMVADF